MLVHAGKARPPHLYRFGPYVTYRDWPTGDLAKPPCRDALLPESEGASVWMPLPLGAVVAVARLADCVLTDDLLAAGSAPKDAGWEWSRMAGAYGIHDDQVPLGNFDTGWAWLLADVRPIDPVPAKGRQGLWRPDDELVAACMEGTSR